MLDDAICSLKVREIEEYDFKGKRVLVRCDFNVPVYQGIISDKMRIYTAVQTLQSVIGGGGYPIILSHFGSPKGNYNPKYSLKIVLDAVEQALGGKVSFSSSCLHNDIEEAMSRDSRGYALLCENVRFHHGEEKNCNEFAKELARSADLYINEAFSVSHRKHASVVKLPSLLPSYAGFNFSREIKVLNGILTNPEKPVVAVIGGAKISSKVSLLKKLVTSCDTVIIGGAMANVFILAMGHSIGKSFCEVSMCAVAQEVLDLAKNNNCKILLPVDMIVTRSTDKPDGAIIVQVDSIPDDMMAVDIGSKTVDLFCTAISQAATVLWNGPLGMYEIPPFHEGTSRVANAIIDVTVDSGAISVAGGGDTLSILSKIGVSSALTYVSTGGGAFLQWLERGDAGMPGLVPLCDNSIPVS